MDLWLITPMNFKRLGLLCVIFSEEARTDEEGSRATWFEVKVPGLDDAFYFSGSPSALGVLGMGVGVVAEVTANITPNGVASWETASTEPFPYIVPIQTQYLNDGNSPLEIDIVVPGVAEPNPSPYSPNTDVVTAGGDTYSITITKVDVGEAYVIVAVGPDANRTVFKVIVS